MPAWLPPSVAVVIALVFAVFTAGAVLMLRDDDRAWIAVPVAIVIGLGVFISDVDFSTGLGLQW